MTAAEVFQRVVEAYADDPRIVKSKLFNAPNLKIGGKVFAMLVKDKLVVKLPRDRVDALIASGEGERFDPGHGRPMKGWIAVGQHSEPSWLDLAEEAKQFVSSTL